MPKVGLAIKLIRNAPAIFKGGSAAIEDLANQGKKIIGFFEKRSPKAETIKSNSSSHATAKDVQHISEFNLSAAKENKLAELFVRFNNPSLKISKEELKRITASIFDETQSDRDLLRKLDNLRTSDEPIGKLFRITLNLLKYIGPRKGDSEQLYSFLMKYADPKFDFGVNRLKNYASDILSAKNMNDPLVRRFIHDLDETFHPIKQATPVIPKVKEPVPATVAAPIRALSRQETVRIPNAVAQTGEVADIGDFVKKASLGLGFKDKISGGSIIKRFRELVELYKNAKSQDEIAALALSSKGSHLREFAFDTVFSRSSDGAFKLRGKEEIDNVLVKVGIEEMKRNTNIMKMTNPLL